MNEYSVRTTSPEEINATLAALFSLGCGWGPEKRADFRTCPRTTQRLYVNSSNIITYATENRLHNSTGVSLQQLLKLLSTRVMVELPHGYCAAVDSGDSIKIGCQTFLKARILELSDEIIRQREGR